MKKAGNSKKKAKSNAGIASREGFSKLFDDVWTEVNTGDRLNVSNMPPPADDTKLSWKLRVADPACPVLAAMKEMYTHAAADSKEFVEALFRHGIGDRRAVPGGDDPENALDGKAVLALMLGYYLALYSEHVGKLFDTYPAAGTIDYDGVWHSVEVLNVPEGENMPPLQRSIDMLIREPRVRLVRKGEASLGDVAETVGNVCSQVYEHMRTTDAAELKKNILELVFFLDGLSATVVKTEEPHVAPSAPPAPVFVPDIIPNLMDASPEPMVIKAEEPLPAPVVVPAPAVVVEEVSWARTPAPVVQAPWIEKPSWSPVYAEEDAFGDRLRLAVAATQDKRKWRV